MTFQRTGADRRVAAAATPSVCRVVDLRLSGMTPREIAAHLGLKPSSVYTRLCMAGCTGPRVRAAIAAAQAPTPTA